MKRPIEVYLEVGPKWTFAGAVDWPGWCRRARGGEKEALDVLMEYGPRYAEALGKVGKSFKPPRDPGAFEVVERLKGNTTTDFGAPDQKPSGDFEPLDEKELQRLVGLLEACWAHFDAVAKAGVGKTLKKGPRGGGRDLAKIREHVYGGDWGYLERLGGPFKPSGKTVWGQAKSIRRAFVERLHARTAGEIPDKGPRGGSRWPPRYAIRRSAWHVLDHAWEIEDRSDG